MNWKEKFQVIKLCSDEELLGLIEDDFYVKDKGSSVEFIKNIRALYPFVTDDYIEFLNMTNGADIAQCRFLEEDNFDSIAMVHSGSYPKEKWMTFGLDAGGNPILLHESGKVALGEGKANKEIYTFVADSFSDFLSEVIMGQRYASIYRIEPDKFIEFYKAEIEEDPWLDFLIKIRWIAV